MTFWFKHQDEPQEWDWLVSLDNNQHTQFKQSRILFYFFCCQLNVLDPKPQHLMSCQIKFSFRTTDDRRRLCWLTKSLKLRHDTISELKRNKGSAARSRRYTSSISSVLRRYVHVDVSHPPRPCSDTQTSNRFSDSEHKEISYMYFFSSEFPNLHVKIKIVELQRSYSKNKSWRTNISQDIEDSKAIIWQDFSSKCWAEMCRSHSCTLAYSDKR